MVMFPGEGAVAPGRRLLSYVNAEQGKIKKRVAYDTVSLTCLKLLPKHDKSNDPDYV